MFPHWKKSGLGEHKMAKKYVKDIHETTYFRAIRYTPRSWKV